MAELLALAVCHKAANDYYKRNWLSMPLALDGNGFAKRPIVDKWTSLKLDTKTIRALPWHSAYGVGIPLGPVSDNLAVIDIDDQALAGDVFALLVRSHVITRMVWTIRHRIHLYFREETATPPQTFKVTWREREIGIELKGRGQQVAAPPTPGYTLCQDIAPLTVPTIRDAWESIASRLNIIELRPANGGAGYPSPWQPQVHKEERNKSIYVEAHKLREAAMPVDQAIDILRLRWEQAYEKGDMAWHEVERTIRSAYQKAEATATGYTTPSSTIDIRALPQYQGEC